ncbi:MAG: CHC2 zinc finger domain-containing protein, partial [Desulfomonilaceae bacterium]
MFSTNNNYKSNTETSQAFNDIIGQIKSKTNFKELLTELYPDVKLKRTGMGSWVGSSPFREDKNPSLQIDKEHCYDHGTKEKLDIIDLYERRFGVNRETAIKNLSKRAGLDRKPSKKDKIVKIYDYTDENGELLYQKVRYEPKSFSQRRPDPDQPGKWITKEVFKHIGHVPYRLRELINSDINSPIVITEGEKDSDSAISIGFISTTMGSKGDASKYFSDPKIQGYFQQRIVWLIADKDIPHKNDKPEDKRKKRAGGYKQFRKVAQALAPVCKEIRLFLLPGRGIKDLADFANVHGDQSKQLVEKLATKAPVYINRVVTEIKTSEKSKPDKPQKKKDKDQAQLIVELIQSEYGLKGWQTPEGDPYVTISVNGHCCFYNVKGAKFKSFLRNAYRSRYGVTLKSNSVKDAVDDIESICEMSPDIYELYVRFCYEKGKVFIDLCDQDWNQIEITSGGWEVKPQTEPRFKRVPETLPLPKPEYSENAIDKFLKVLTVEDASHQLFIKCWLIVACIANIPRPIFLFNGAPGSAKSGLATGIRDTVDPNILDRVMPNWDDKRT